jgi:hypothetical protein
MTAMSSLSCLARARTTVECGTQQFLASSPVPQPGCSKETSYFRKNIPAISVETVPPLGKIPPNHSRHTESSAAHTLALQYDVVRPRDVQYQVTQFTTWASITKGYLYQPFRICHIEQDSVPCKG